MAKRCSTCARKLNADGKCTNEKCPECLKDKMLAELKQEGQKEVDILPMNKFRGFLGSSDLA